MLGISVDEYHVSVLFNEPKLLKSYSGVAVRFVQKGFSALQRAEIAEIDSSCGARMEPCRFSALQRAEIAEKVVSWLRRCLQFWVSVLFNEPKLLKLSENDQNNNLINGFSALQRAEIAETASRVAISRARQKFQCSSTSRNC